MRFIRDIFESEASGVFSLLERGLTKVGGGDSQSIEIVGSGIGGSHPSHLLFPGFLASSEDLWESSNVPRMTIFHRVRTDFFRFSASPVLFFLVVQPVLSPSFTVSTFITPSLPLFDEPRLSSPPSPPLGSPTKPSPTTSNPTTLPTSSSTSSPPLRTRFLCSPLEEG